MWIICEEFVKNFPGLQNSKFYHLFYIYKDPQTHWRRVMRVSIWKLLFVAPLWIRTTLLISFLNTLLSRVWTKGKVRGVHKSEPLRKVVPADHQDVAVGKVVIYFKYILIKRAKLLQSYNYILVKLAASVEELREAELPEKQKLSNSFSIGDTIAKVE